MRTLGPTISYLFVDVALLLVHSNIVGTSFAVVFRLSDGTLFGRLISDFLLKFCFGHFLLDLLILIPNNSLIKFVSTDLIEQSSFHHFHFSACGSFYR